MEKDAGDALSALRAQHHELAGILEGLSAKDWQRPTRCPGWSVSDVVLHLAQTDEMAIASLQDRVAGFLAERAGGGEASTVDDGADLMVARERGISVTSVQDRWAAASGQLDEMLQAADGHRRVVWVAGELSIRTLATTRLAETWIHTGDVAEAVGVRHSADDRLWHIARLAWRTLPYAFAREGLELAGPVSFELTGPSGDRWSFSSEDAEAATVVRGDAVELCLVAARRIEPAETALVADGADAVAVLSLVRTYA